MKYVMLFLVLLNIVYFMWERNIKVAKPRLASETPLYNTKVLEPLVLLKENELGESSVQSVVNETVSLEEVKIVGAEKVAELPVVDQASSKNTSCLDVGDFNSQQQASAFMAKLLGLKKPLSVVMSESLSKHDYWVVFPAAETWAKSLANSNELQDKQIGDSWLVPRGEDKGAVSLGLFASLERANKRLDELLEKNIQAQVKEKITKHYSVRIGDVFDFKKVMEEVKQLNGDETIKIQHFDCEAVAESNVIE